MSFTDKNSLKNDVWYTSNGRDWKQATANAGWSPRAYHQAAVLNNKIYVYTTKLKYKLKGSKEMIKTTTKEVIDMIKIESKL